VGWAASLGCDLRVDRVKRRPRGQAVSQDARPGTEVLAARSNRTIIGRAQGVLMERYDMTADQAFDYLRRISSNSNRKLAAVAAEVAETRRITDGG
jgi:AmiR/NasT family two-component response regulator